MEGDLGFFDRQINDILNFDELGLSLDGTDRLLGAILTTSSLGLILIAIF